MIPNPKLRGRCKELAQAAADADPTLRIVRGHYMCPVWGAQPHWWCVRPDGTIVDPSGAQFPSFDMAGPNWYVEYDGAITCASCGKSGLETELHTGTWDIIGNGRYVVCSYTCHGHIVGF